MPFPLFPSKDDDNKSAATQFDRNRDNDTILAFKAGRMKLEEGWITASPEKGEIVISYARTGEILFSWRSRETLEVKEKVTIFPSKAKFERIPQCKTGRAYLLHFPGSSDKERLFYWMQGRDESLDSKICKKVNDIISSGSSGTEFGEATLIEVPLMALLNDSLSEDELTALLSELPLEDLLALLMGLTMLNYGDDEECKECEVEKTSKDERVAERKKTGERNLQRVKAAPNADSSSTLKEGEDREEVNEQFILAVLSSSENNLSLLTNNKILQKINKNLPEGFVHENSIEALKSKIGTRYFSELVRAFISSFQAGDFATEDFAPLKLTLKSLDCIAKKDVMMFAKTLNGSQELAAFRPKKRKTQSAPARQTTAKKTPKMSLIDEESAFESKLKIVALLREKPCELNVLLNSDRFHKILADPNIQSLIAPVATGEMEIPKTAEEVKEFIRQSGKFDCVTEALETIITDKKLSPQDVSTFKLKSGVLNSLEEGNYPNFVSELCNQEEAEREAEEARREKMNASLRDPAVRGKLGRLMSKQEVQGKMSPHLLPGVVLPKEESVFLKLADSPVFSEYLGALRQAVKRNSDLTDEVLKELSVEEAENILGQKSTEKKIEDLYLYNPEFQLKLIPILADEKVQKLLAKETSNFQILSRRQLRHSLCSPTFHNLVKDFKQAVERKEITEDVTEKLHLSDALSKAIKRGSVYQAFKILDTEDIKVLTDELLCCIKEEELLSVLLEEKCRRTVEEFLTDECELPRTRNELKDVIDGVQFLEIIQAFKAAIVTGSLKRESMKSLSKEKLDKLFDLMEKQPLGASDSQFLRRCRKGCDNKACPMFPLVQDTDVTIKKLREVLTKFEINWILTHDVIFPLLSSFLPEQLQTSSSPFDLNEDVLDQLTRSLQAALLAKKIKVEDIVSLVSERSAQNSIYDLAEALQICSSAARESQITMLNWLLKSPRFRPFLLNKAVQGKMKLRMQVGGCDLKFPGSTEDWEELVRDKKQLKTASTCFMRVLTAKEFSSDDLALLNVGEEALRASRKGDIMEFIDAFCRQLCEETKGKSAE